MNLPDTSLQKEPKEAEMFYRKVDTLLRELNPNAVKVSLEEIVQHYWSFGIVAHVASNTDTCSFYLKFPKARVETSTPYAPSEADRTLGAAEAQAHLRLRKSWSENAVRLPHIVTYNEDLNCLVLEFIHAQDFFRKIRRGLNPQTKNVIHDLAVNLATFHRQGEEFEVFDRDRFMSRVAKLKQALNQIDHVYPVTQAFVEYTTRACANLDSEKIPYSDTMKGFDIRNLLWCDAGAILIDPGKIKRDALYADIARFIVTLRMSYWGTLWALALTTPSREIEEVFIRAYQTRGAALNRRILHLFVIKELLRHFLLVSESLQRRKWPKIIKNFLHKYYINRFFKFLLRSEQSDQI